MIVREYQPEDLEALRALHAAQGFGYPFPDLSDPLFVTRLVLAEQDTGDAPKEEKSLRSGPQETRPSGRDDSGAGGRIVGAALLRLTAEAYLLLDPRAGTPRERWTRLLALHAAAEDDAWRRGLADVHAWLPPPIAGKFGRRLARLGWVRDDAWTPYCKRLSGESR
ncbi:MAG: hypothetical protein LAN84_06425 [Acidobacteriia bacterium]|nr:hypothetical protein [Terriglobia bacterium]